MVADAIAGSDYRRMSKGVVRRATAGLPRNAYWEHADVVAASCKSGYAVEASQVAAGAAKRVRPWV